MKNGLLTGRIGDRLYYVRNGVQCVRSYKKKLMTGEQSAKQAQHHRSFVSVIRFMKPLGPVLRYSCATANSLTGMNRAVKYAFAHALDKEQEYGVDPARILVSMGSDVVRLAYPVAAIQGPKVLLQWQINESPCNHYYNLVYLLAYNVEQGTIQLSTGGTLYGEKQLVMELEEEVRMSPFYLYTFVTDRYQSRYSKSQYLGKFQSSINPQS